RSPSTFSIVTFLIGSPPALMSSARTNRGCIIEPIIARTTAILRKVDFTAMSLLSFQPPRLIHRRPSTTECKPQLAKPAPANHHSVARMQEWGDPFSPSLLHRKRGCP